MHARKPTGCIVRAHCMGDVEVLKVDAGIAGIQADRAAHQNNTHAERTQRHGSRVHVQDKAYVFMHASTPTRCDCECEVGAREVQAHAMTRTPRHSLIGCDWVGWVEAEVAASCGVDLGEGRYGRAGQGTVA